MSNGVWTDTLAREDGTAAPFVGRTLLRTVSAPLAASVYEVRRRGGRVVKTALPRKRHRLLPAAVGLEFLQLVRGAGNLGRLRGTQ